jgi:hypothetical protein
MKKKVVISLDYDELDSLIEDGFGMRQGSYEVVAQDELNNYTSKEYRVKPKALNDEDLLEVAAAAAETLEPSERYGGNIFNVRFIGTPQLLDHLCAIGKIEAGDYVMRVSW